MKKKNVFRIIISVILTCIVFALYRGYTDFIYLTNDDMYLQSIVSGEISGNPDPHMIYSNYILGILLSTLYKVNISIPWYGLYLEGSLAVCFCLLLYRFLRCTEKKWEQAVLAAGFMAVMTFVLFRHVAMVQYTVVSVVVGATAIFYALTLDMRQDLGKFVKQIILILLLAALSFMIRDQAFMMLVPFAGCGWIGKWVLEKEKTKQIHFRFASLIIGICGMVLLLGGIDLLAYRGNSQTQKEWKSFLQYNEAREQIYDYYGFPDYEINRELYDSLEINRESLEAASLHYMLLPQQEYNTENMIKLAERTKEDAKKLASEKGIRARIQIVLKAFLERNFSYTDRPLNVVVYGAWLCVFVLVIVTRNRKLLLQSLLLFATRMGIWMYLIWRGRYPDRITQGLYFAELLMLLAFCMEYGGVMRKRISSLLPVLLILCIPAVYLGIPKMQAVKGENAGKLYFGTSYTQLKEYCSRNEDNLYLADMNSVSSFSSSIFTGNRTDSVCNNFLPMGSWVSKSPLVTETLNRYGIFNSETDLVNCEHAFFVFKDSQITTMDYLVDFYSSIMGNIESVRVDTLYTDAGIDYGIYQLRRQVE